jgi:hypothetical protein
MDSATAREVWLETGSGMAANMIRTERENMEKGTHARKMNGWLGGKSFATQTLAGVSCYYNGETGNWAFFDANHKGTASIDGNLMEISPDNWRKSQDGHFEIRMDGRWKIANVDPVLPDGPQTTRLAQGPDDAAQNPQNPYGFGDDPYVNRYIAALYKGDSDEMDRIAIEFSQTPEGQEMARMGDELLAQQQQAERLQRAPDPREPGHPDHDRFEKIHQVLYDDGRWDDTECANIAAQLLVAHKADGLSNKRLDDVVIGGVTAEGKVNIFAVYSPYGRSPEFSTHVDTGAAACIPAEQGFEQLAQVNQQLAIDQQQAQLRQQQEQGRGMSL